MAFRQLERDLAAALAADGPDPCRTALLVLLAEAILGLLTSVLGLTRKPYVSG
ncbi:MAG TPA: hypothetical protein VGD34_09210 [Kribbella sp.]